MCLYIRIYRYRFVRYITDLTHNPNTFIYLGSDQDLYK